MILGSICCRGGSKGVPGKALRPLAGRPLLAWTVECALACPELDRVVVSTDDHAIAAIGRECGAEVPFLRPEALARDDSPKWEVFRHLVESLEAEGSKRVEVLVDLDIGVPLRRPEDVARCIRALSSGTADVVASAFRPDRNPYFNMVEPAGDGSVRIVKTPERPIHNRQESPTVWALSPAAYVIRRDCLWRFDHWSQARLEVVELPRERAWDIDEEIDLAFIEFLLARRTTTEVER